jgi:hypothetical protein
MASNDRPTVADMVGIWKDAFPEGIDLPDGPYLIARYRLNR